MIEDLFDVLRRSEVEAFVGLSHEVADVDARGVRGCQGLRDAADQKIADDRGVERAGAEGNEVGCGDGVERFG